MRISICFALLLVAACGAQQPAARYKSPSGAEFAADRDACMQNAQFVSSGNRIAFGGGFGGNPFTSAGPYFDCMVARGYAPDNLGDILGTPATTQNIGGQ